MNMTHYMELLSVNQPWNLLIFMGIPVVLAETLAITEGLEVIALVKAPQMIIATDLGGYRLSARNQLLGTVTKVIAGVVNSEIDITLNGGDLIAATMTNDSVDNLALQEGQSAIAIFKAGSVILAVN